MSEQTQERFELSEFVLGYLNESGSIVMPPEFGIYDVLMPDDVAANLAVEEHARFAFGRPKQDGIGQGVFETDKEPEGKMLTEQEPDLVQLGVSHPMVENIALKLTSNPANIRAFIRGVRTDKQGLVELARKDIALPNGRIEPLPKTQEQATQHHYLLCNFKVTYLSEEKEEDLVTLVMDVQGGYPVEDEAILQRLEVLDTEPAYTALPNASIQWKSKESTLDAGNPLAVQTLQALLPRAEKALQQKLHTKVDALTARMERHLLLDLARIGDYYDEMAMDLQKRQNRLSADDERRQDFDDKLATLETERQAKLDDAQNRYTLRVEMKLVNVLIATQAKVDLPVSIGNRTSKITRTLVWDPLLHRLEPLLCDVCGDPGEGLHLCTGGHLAHERCLNPQCIDCKREFCQLCMDKTTECVVCQQPVCKPSLIQCSTCGRGTCNEHKTLCHAEDGQPAVLSEPTAAAEMDEKPTTELSSQTDVSSQLAASLMAQISKGQSGNTSSSAKANKSSSGSNKRSKSKSKPKAKPKTAPRTPVTKGVRMDVQIYEHEPAVVAFVMKSTNRVLATRSFRLTQDGIQVHCECEKTSCPAHGYTHYPRPSSVLPQQLLEWIKELQTEYLLPTKKIKFYNNRFGEFEEKKRLVLPRCWLNEERLTEARRGFDKISGQ